jgi:hypothetical protein
VCVSALLAIAHGIRVADERTGRQITVAFDEVEQVASERELPYCMDRRRVRASTVSDGLGSLRVSASTSQSPVVFNDGLSYRV